MSKELGTLVIVVLKGQHLIDNHTFYKQDPYVKLSLSGATKQTPVDPKGGQHPVWDAEIRFPISKDPSKSNRTLAISVFSEEKKEDELLGEANIDITDTLKSGEFDDWVPLSLKGTQRGDVYLEMTFFAAGPAPLSRRPSKFTNPVERLARPQQQPVAQQRPQRLAPQPLPASLAPGQAQRPNSNEANRAGRSRIQQVPLPGPWPGPSAQQRQSTLPSASSVPMRRSSKGEDAPLPPLPPDAPPPREEFVPSILRPGGPSRMGITGAPSPPIPNGTAGHHHATQNDSGSNAAYPPRHHTVNQSMPPYPGSPVPQAHVRTSSPQPQPQPPPPTQPHSSHLAYSTQGTMEHTSSYSQGGHATTTTQPFPQAQPEVSQHTQYHSQSHTPPQMHQQVQHSTWQQAQPQGGPPPHIGSPYPADNHPPQPYFPNPPGPSSPGQSYVSASSPKPPPQPYAAPQIASPPVPSHITPQSPPPVPHARPYGANTSPVPSARPHSTSPSPGIPPPTHQYVHPTQQYSPAPPPSAPPYATSTSPVPIAQSYAPPPGPVLSPPPQSAAPSSHMPPYFSTPNSAFPLPTSPPPAPPHSPTYAHPPAPSFPVPSFPVPQTTAYFEPVAPGPFSPPPEPEFPEFPDPYLRRRYEAPLPLPQGAPQAHHHPQRTSPDRRPQEPPIPPLAPAASSSSSSRSTSSSIRRVETEDERAAREWQRWEEEDARARREQEEKDAELARTLDLELNMGGSGGGGGGTQDGHGRTAHSQLPPLSTGVARKSSVGEW